MNAISRPIPSPNPGTFNKTLTLADLSPGQNVRIIVLHAETDPGLVRLMEIGLIPGQAVQMIKHAPFGDPIEVRVMNYNLVLRKKEASAILVELI